MTARRRSLDTTVVQAAQDGLAADVYGRIVSSEVAGGVRMHGLPEGARLRVETRNRTYEILLRDGETWIRGHPQLCPRPVPVQVHGSTWGGSMLKRDYLGLGMCMEFHHPVYSRVTTSTILSVDLL